MATYLPLAIVTLAMLDGPVPLTMFLLGFGMGNANLIAWTLLATLARGALPFGLFTMLSKVALGGSALMVVASCMAGPCSTAPISGVWSPLRHFRRSFRGFW